jgi:hypothetical protein
MKKLNSSVVSDWPEDFKEENGCYSNECVHCEKFFTGHKRRTSCKACYIENLELLCRQLMKDTQQ